MIDTHGSASGYLVNPFGVISGASNRLDLYPLPSALEGGPVDLSGLSTYQAWNLDFNGTPRPGTFRGGYAGGGANPGWVLALERKPESVLFADGFESGDTGAWSYAGE